MSRLLENKQFLSELRTLIDKYSEEEKPFKIEKGKWYMCIKDYIHGSEKYQKGKVYKATDDNELCNNGIKDYGRFDLSCFRPAAEEAKPHKPKFKPGYWIAESHSGSCVRIEEVTETSYKTSDSDIIPFAVENLWHLWTIDDAKEGDVLVTTHDNGIGTIIFIFKRITDDEIFCHCCYDTSISKKLAFDPCLGASDFVGGIEQKGEEYSPATKKQRDLLFQKMREAGYEWDTEKLELKKIVTRWRDSTHNKVGGYYIEHDATTRFVDKVYVNIPSNGHIFATEAQAKSALAMARISQIMANDPRFGGVVTDEEWENGNYLYVIGRDFDNLLYKDENTDVYHFLAFHTEQQRDLFLKENEDLVYDYLMIKKR